MKFVKSFFRNLFGKKTDHQARIEEFMYRGGQSFPDKPTVPDKMIRILRARLVMEEALELLEAMQVVVRLKVHTPETLDKAPDDSDVAYFHTHFDRLMFDVDDSISEVAIDEVAKEAADLSVVTIGTLSAFGINDKELLEAVDDSNIAKFAAGWYRDENGKVRKPPGWKKPDIKAVLFKGGDK